MSKIPAKIAAETGSKKPAKPVYAHGRPLCKQGGFCQTCKWLDAPNESIGNPAGLGCRIVRGVVRSTPACDQYSPSPAVSNKALNEILAKTKGKLRGGMGAGAGTCLTSGSLWSDLVIGGGVAPGRVYTKAGLPHAGKTSDLMETMGDALSSGIETHLYDAEGAIDWEYVRMILRKWGVELTWDVLKQEWTHPKLRIVNFPSGDAWFAYMAWVLKQLPDYESGRPSVLFICDSAANLVPKMLAEDPNKDPMAAQARMFSTGFLVMRSLLQIKGGGLAFTNHINEKPGVVFGSREYMKGGKALHHHSDVVEWKKPKASKLPDPAPAKGGTIFERSWTGSGKDRLCYSQSRFKKNRRTGSSTDVTYTRICFKEGGGRGSGVDRSWDIFQFLSVTGQAEWIGRNRIELKIMAPVYKDGEVTYEKKKGLYAFNTTMSWPVFRENVYKEMITPGSTDTDLYALCRTQMATNFAFERYRENTQDDDIAGGSDE